MVSGQLIIAPHPDDEIVGCWLKLKSKEVDAVLFMASERRNEAMNSAKRFNFNPLFAEEVDDLETLMKSYDVIYVPHPADHHPEHKIATITVQGLHSKAPVKIKYYSTDMNIPWAIKPLGKLSKEKYNDLVRCYPSQKSEFDVNHHWWLFEGVTDYPSLPKVSAEVPFLGYHYYPDAPERRAYLRFKHQHVFTVKAELAVLDLNREVEFHDLREELMTACKACKAKFDKASVEEMAYWLWRHLKGKYNTYIKVCVCEEGNLCGCYGDLLW